MREIHQQRLAYLRQFLDIILIGASWQLAYLFRFYYLEGGQSNLGPLFLKLGPVVIFITFYFLYKNGLYHSQRFKTLFNELLTTCKANSLAMMALVILLYFLAENRLSRLMLLSHFIFSSCLLISVRIVVKKILGSLRRRGKYLCRTVLIGSGKQMENYVQVINNCYEIGIKAILWLDSKGLAEKYRLPFSSLSISDIKEKNSFDMIVVGYAGEDSKKLEIFFKRTAQ